MAIFHTYKVAETTYSYITTYYRALATVAGQYSEGDVLREVAQINDSTGLPTGTSSWYNVDTDTALSGVPAPANIESVDGSRVALTSAPLTVSNVAAGVGLPSIPANANYAEVHIWNADVSITLDGTAPTTTGVGFRQANGQTFELESRTELTNFKAIRLASTDALLHVQYYRVFTNAQ